MRTQSDNDNWFRPDDFSVTVIRGADGLTLLRLSGEFDLSTAADLRECLADPEVLDAERVRIDLSQVTYLDSATVGVLVAAAKAVRKNGGAFFVSCGDGLALQVLRVSGLIDFFEVESTSNASTSSAW